MISKMHAMLLSVFPQFKFRFDAPLIHTVSVYFVKSWVVASIPGFFVCMWCACLANSGLGTSSCIQGIEMLSLVSLKIGAILLLVFPTADAALPSSMLFIGDTVIYGICIALALCIAIPRFSKNRFFYCAFLRYTVTVTVTIILMNWFQAAQPASGVIGFVVIGFVAIHCLWNEEVKQLMGNVWDWNMYRTKLEKLNGWVDHTANEDGNGGEDDATALPEDCGDGSDDGSSSGSDGGDDGDDPEDGSSSSIASDDGIYTGRAVQLLAIRANFRTSCINAYDCHSRRHIYSPLDGQVQEEGMVDLVPFGPREILEAYGPLCWEVFPADDTDDVITAGWSVDSGDDFEEIEEHTKTIDGGLGRKLEVTYLVMSNAIETAVWVRLNLKDLGSRNRAVYGTIKASNIDYGSKSVHLFSCERARSMSFPCGCTCNLELTPCVIALPYHRHFKVQIKVDLTVITTNDSQEEGKNLKFDLDFTRKIRSQYREVDGDKVEVYVTWNLRRTI